MFPVGGIKVGGNPQMMNGEEETRKVCFEHSTSEYEEFPPWKTLAFYKRMENRNWR